MNSLRYLTVRALALLAATFLLYALPVAAQQQTKSFSVGNNPSTLTLDAATGKFVITNVSSTRYPSSGALSVLDPSGQTTTIAIPGDTRNIAISSAYRTVIAPVVACTCTALVNIDTHAVTQVASGENVQSTFVNDKTGHAYLLAGGLGTDGAFTGSMTDVDLRARTSQVYPVDTFSVWSMVADPTGTKLYVLGRGPGGFASPLKAYVQVFDIASMRMVGAPVYVGLQAVDVIAPASGSEIYVLAHTPVIDNTIPSNDPRHNSIQPTLFVLDSTTLATKRSALLPYTTNIDLFSAALSGHASLDPTTGMVYVSDRDNQRFMIVDPVAASVSTINVESYVNQLVVNPVAGNVALLLSAPGVAAIYSLSGERLDTVPLTAAFDPANPVYSDFDMAVDASGNAYVSVGKDQSVVMLKSDSAPLATVNLTDVWSDPADPGWGVFVQQHGTVALAALFIHDAAGSPRWAVMPQGARQGDGSFSGSLYRTTGPATSAGATAASVVGTMQFTAKTLQQATLTYTLDGNTVTRSVSRLPISSVPRTCGWSTTASLKATPSASTNFTSLWWNPAQSGWGLALSQQGNTAFAVMFGYDTSNQPTWSVMADGLESAATAFGGTLYRAMSSGVQTAGDMSLSFTATDAGTLSYHLDGVQVSTPIAREDFSTPMSRCSS